MTKNEQKLLDFFRNIKIKADARLHEQRTMIDELRCECDALAKECAVHRNSDELLDIEIERTRSLNVLNTHLVEDNARLRRENLGIWTAGITASL
jgi:hypothetical protein